MDDCFTGHSSGNAISVPAAPDVHDWQTAGRRGGKGRF